MFFPKKGTISKGKDCLPTIIFSGYVSFRGNMNMVKHHHLGKICIHFFPSTIGNSK